MQRIERKSLIEPISKDDLQVGQRKLQEVVDKYNEEIKKHAEAKEKEVMTV